MNIITKVLLDILLHLAVGQCSSINDSHFYAGVVEFRPDFIGLSTAQMIAKHTEAYIEILQSAEAHETDIVVFPESTLNNAFQPSVVPSAESAIIPCLLANQASEYENFLVQLSCAARSTRKYVVINLTEKEDCTKNAKFDPRPCAPNGLNIYNTEVVFDRDGRVISRYRKVNLYLEPMNTTLKPEFAIFDTDFGVRFGNFICFDLLFYTPTEELVVKYGVKNIIFSANFIGELPFLTAVQLQQAWSWGNNVTLLAAGGSYPSKGGTGSGIYLGDDGALTAAMIGGTGIRKIFVAKVPKMRPQQPTNITRQFSNLSTIPQTGMRLLRDPQLDNFKSQLLPLSSSSGVISVHQCFDEQLCCDLSAETTASERTYGNGSDGSQQQASYLYRFGVFKGSRSYEKEQYSDVAICGMYACSNETVASCGLLFPANITIKPGFAFKRLKITGNFTKAARSLLMPNSLNLNFYSLQPEQVEWSVANEGKTRAVSIDLKTPADNLLTFGIYGNYYDSFSAPAPAAAPTQGDAVMLLWSCVTLWLGMYIMDLLHIKYYVK